LKIQNAFAANAKTETSAELEIARFNDTLLPTTIDRKSSTAERSRNRQTALKRPAIAVIRTRYRARGIISRNFAR